MVVDSSNLLIELHINTLSTKKWYVKGTFASWNVLKPNQFTGTLTNKSKVNSNLKKYISSLGQFDVKRFTHYNG